MTRAPAAATVRADSVSEYGLSERIEALCETPDELRSFLRDSLSLLPAGIQIAVMEAIQQSGAFFRDDYGLWNHASLLVMLATKEGEA